MDMPWPALRSLHELSRLGTIAAVAEARGYTPGAVSQQLAALERAVGQPLLTRVGRGVQLTDAGTVLVAHAERMLQNEEDARRALQAVAGEAVGTIRVATFATSAATLLGPAINAAAERHPRLAVVSVELDPDVAADAVRRGHVDVALGLDYPDVPVARAPGVEVTTLASERYAIAVPDDHPSEHRVPLSATAEWGWILAPDATSYGRAIRAACRRAGFEPRVAHEITDTAVSLSMVSQGLGVAAVTAMMLALAPGRPPRTVELEEELRRDIILITRAGDDQRPAVRAMRDVIEAAIQNDEGRRRSAALRTTS